MVARSSFSPLATGVLKYGNDVICDTIARTRIKILSCAVAQLILAGNLSKARTIVTIQAETDNRASGVVGPG